MCVQVVRGLGGLCMCVECVECVVRNLNLQSVAMFSSIFLTQILCLVALIMRRVVKQKCSQNEHVSLIYHHDFNCM